MKRFKYFTCFMSVDVGYEFVEELGFDCVLGCEIHPVRSRWAQERHPNADIVADDFTKPEVFAELVRKFKEKHCILGCFSPNCQPFSRAGKSHLHSKEAYWFLYIIEFIKLTNMPCALIENAKEFRNAVLDDDPRTIEQRFRDELEPLGYHIEVKTQDAAGFKTPQHRRRTIFLISRIGEWKHPIECDPEDYVTAEQAIGHLEPLKAGERSRRSLHNGPYLPKCQVACLIGVPEGESPKVLVNAKGNKPKKPRPGSIARRMRRNKPSPTLLQKSDSITGYNPVHYRDDRMLTVLEVILLTGLPEDWFIPIWARNDEALIREVIGEAFAPHHVKALFETLLEILPKDDE